MRPFGWMFLAASLLPAATMACINDRDTLAFEKRNVDALSRVQNAPTAEAKAEAATEIALRAISGRFDRFPERYYRMRIERLEMLPKLTANEYDDLAVAYERLGQTDKALKILEKSKSVRKTKDDEYRLLANRGTFMVHKWIAGGHSEKNIKFLNQANVDIARALEINPNSHFGREKYQLYLQKTWFDAATGHELPMRHLERETTGPEPMVAYAGIVMMGLGYELPDVYSQIPSGHMSGGAGLSMISDFAQLRADELVADGKSYVYPGLNAEPHTIGEDAKEPYAKIRKDGEDVFQARLAYMNERLDRGEHPDTHPDFWKEWEEPAAPYLKREEYHRQRSTDTVTAWLFGAVAVACVGSPIWIGLFMIYRKVRLQRRP
jgi:tetratricopeptide (TPR) repeat protein